MDRVQKVDEENLFTAFSRTKWGVCAESDTEASNVNGPFLTVAPDLPRTQPAAIARHRTALLRRSTAIAVRIARIDDQ